MKEALQACKQHLKVNTSLNIQKAGLKRMRESITITWISNQETQALTFA